jgi:hypothetical protein
MRSVPSPLVARFIRRYKDSGVPLVPEPAGQRKGLSTSVYPMYR